MGSAILKPDSLWTLRRTGKPSKVFVRKTRLSRLVYTSGERTTRISLPLLWRHNPDSAFGIVVLTALENSVRVQSPNRLKSEAATSRHKP